MRSLKPLGYYKEKRRFKLGGCEKCGGAMELTDDNDGYGQYYKCLNCGYPDYKPVLKLLKGRPSIR